MKKDNSTLKLDEKAVHYTRIGGQAVIEGVMMKGPTAIATAVRKSNGEIVVEKKELKASVSKNKILKLPIIRGVVAFISSMVTGVKCLMYSADQVDFEDEEGYEESKFEKWLDEKFGDKISDIVIYFSVFISLIFSVGLFMILPNLIAGLFKNFTENTIILNIIEGAAKICIFLVYLILVSQMKDIKRVFEYHGAEHKTIAMYESGEELTVENARKFPRLHPRCGTSFLLIVMIISIIFFMAISWESVWQRLLYRLLLLPVVAGLSYEVITFTGKSKNRCIKWLTKPGLWLQKLTTREPDDSQIEVAIEALKNVLTGNKEDDKW